MKANIRCLPCRAATAVICLSLGVLFIGVPLLNDTAARLEQGALRAQQKRQATLQSLRELRDDIALTGRLEGEAAAGNLEKYLLPVDRLQVVRSVEQQAAAARLQHFIYTLSPEQKRSMETPSSGAQDFAESTLNIDADAALDGDVYDFLARLMRTLPGRARLQELVLERTRPAAAPEIANNLHMHAQMLWLSNGSLAEAAQAP